MRRSSAGQDGKMVRTTVPVKANYEQMKDHLKHLGPSNPASNPKSTKVQSVKIKPGGGSQTRSGSVATEAPDSQNDTDGVNERTSLLRPPPSGNEGHRGSLQSYTSPLQTSEPSNREDVEPFPETPKLLITTNTDAQDVETNAQIQTVGSSVSLAGSSKSIVSSLNSGAGLSTAERQRVKRGYVRSGSITETEVNTGGVRKFVLEATSSGDDEAGGSSSKASPTSTTRPLEDVKEDDKSDEAEAPGSTGRPNSESSQGQPKKKNNRRKKRKGGK